MANRFVLNTISYHGSGAIKEIPGELQRRGYKKVFVCSDPDLVKFGVTAKVTDELDAAGIAWSLYSEIKPNPTIQNVKDGVEAFKAAEADAIVTIGGGSSMDTAKAIKALLLAPDAGAVLAGQWEARPLAHLAIPATAGTGSEATSIAVMYVEGKKHSLDHHALLPEAVILDPDLLASLPLYHKKSCALDALCQGIESYWARKATEDSQVDAFLAFTGVLDNLRPYLAGDPGAAAEIQFAAYRSGCAIAVSRTTAAHALSYRLTTRYGLAHGHACMLTLPTVWEAMLEDTDVLPVLMDLAQKMRLGSELMGPRLLRGMLYDLEMPFPPAPDADALEDLTQSVNLQRLSNNPRIFTREEIRDIYRRSMMPLTGPERQACLDIWRYYGR